jgi:hypothetical protein
MTPWLPLRSPAEHEQERARHHDRRPSWSLVNPAARQTSPETSVIVDRLR